MTTKVKPLGVKNYGSIPHLVGSTRNQIHDKWVSGQLQKWFTEDFIQFKTHHKGMKIYVDEKVDGSNVGVTKHHGEIIPLQRLGYPIDLSNHGFLVAFDPYVSQRHAIYDRLLNEGERVTGEWIVKAHSVRYDLPHEPFLAFDIFDKNNVPLLREEVSYRLADNGIMMPKCIHSGGPLSIEDGLDILGTSGFHGCRELPEGLVYRLENDNKVLHTAKYVRPFAMFGQYLNLDGDRYSLADQVFNTWTGDFDVSTIHVIDQDMLLAHEAAQLL